MLATNLGEEGRIPYGSMFHETPTLKRFEDRSGAVHQQLRGQPAAFLTRTSILTRQYAARTGIAATACHINRGVSPVKV